MQWKKNPDFDRLYTYIKSLFSKTSPDRDKNIELFAKTCGIEKEEFETLLSQPHGLQRLMTGKIYLSAHADADHKRSLALELALLFSDHVINNGGKFEDIYFGIKYYIQENMMYRKEEDAEIKEENKIMPLIHKVLEVEMEKERQESVKPDTLSEEERLKVNKIAVEFQIRGTVRQYWMRVISLMAGGLSEEHAREKIYQDIVDRGDPEMAKKIREFQDKYHAIKDNS